MVGQSKKDSDCEEFFREERSLFFLHASLRVVAQIIRDGTMVHCCYKGAALNSPARRESKPVILSTPHLDPLPKGEKNSCTQRSLFRNNSLTTGWATTCRFLMPSFLSNVLAMESDRLGLGYLHEIPQSRASELPRNKAHVIVRCGRWASFISRQAPDWVTP